MTTVQTSDKPIDFSVARNGTNVVLVAEGEEIHVNKEFLAAHSPYFNTLLLSPNFAESSCARIEIDHDYGDLLMCIEIVHGKGPLPCGTIKFNLLKQLILSSDRFDLPVVRRFCETEMAARRTDLVMMFHMACHYKFDEAKSVILDRMTKDDVRSWLTNSKDRFNSPSSYNLNLTAADLDRLMKMLV